MRDKLKEILIAMDYNRRFGTNPHFMTEAIDQVVDLFIESLGEDEEQNFSEYGYCERCSHEPTDGTSNCICTFRNSLRQQLREEYKK